MPSRSASWSVLLAAGLIVAGAPAWGQKPVAIQGGLNFSTFGGPDAGGADGLNGWHMGAVASLGAGRLGFVPGLLLSRKGASRTIEAVSARVTLTYLQAPALLHYRFGDTREAGTISAFLYGGPAVAYRLACRVTMTIPGDTDSWGCDDPDEFQTPLPTAGSTPRPSRGPGWNSPAFRSRFTTTMDCRTSTKTRGG